jgi:hypothetical protein
MQQQIKGIVRPPLQMPPELLEHRSRAVKQIPKPQIPLLIRLFAWYCLLQATACLVCALIVTLAPASAPAVYVSAHFNPLPWSPQIAFFLLTALFGYIAFRWLRRDWRARWALMFASGASVARTLIYFFADRAAGAPTHLSPQVQQAVAVSLVVNLFIFSYLAFYPGMDQAFKETPWD